MPLSQPADIDDLVLSQFTLKGKIALVTGASKRIGLQVVTGVAEAGADVAFIHKTSTDADATAARVSKKTGARISAYQSDVTDRKGLASTIKRIFEEFGNGRLDIVVANVDCSRCW